MKKIFLSLSLFAFVTPAWSHGIVGVGTSTWSADYACTNAQSDAEEKADQSCTQMDPTSYLSAIRFGDHNWTLSADTYTCRISAYYTCY